MSDQYKKLAAERAADDVTSGMRLGIGTGSTAEFFVHALARRVQDGLDVIGVPTSERTRELASSLGIRLTTLDELPELDLTVDGADELDPHLSLIKGGGGALLREKIVASASANMIVIADGSKEVATLGRFPLPIEVVPFGLEATRRAILKVFEDLGLPLNMALRGGSAQPFVTDGGHFILDAQLESIPEVQTLGDRLVAIPGVVEHGLFIELATKAYVAGTDGVKTVLPI
ncbi:ribose 5-phosphate isomerase [Labrenzia sp. CP4]|jgi:ribose 5-phosphate isomerase A|uniref:ribose-5-phosphate isomerase RpiA n=1 Tax=Stappiaceae TaxID=2821832 RepID=UPI000782517D|nr:MULTISPECIES: ribose-5-phosphate isomerase RpiA [Stappiaceae]AMN53935.1 ribose 5-phosphate isomerase [Labrenzia sp. CP4]MCR9282530.1 ribose-5-phosphate isomerase RpiA [Paracoccaceae bacterium]UES51556.1 ribose-5-phosphate isomerase RpiA [Roseibium aggregatum]UES57311.1 ribose-5-phosphate isomerase RpiA [Roseibium aggregatum]